MYFDKKRKDKNGKNRERMRGQAAKEYKLILNATNSFASSLVYSSHIFSFGILFSFLSLAFLELFVNLYVYYGADFCLCLNLTPSYFSPFLY